jgi:hypothetical protein
MSALARALLPIAHRALTLPHAPEAVDAPARGCAYDALDGFLGEPIASRYLMAVRALGALSRLRRRGVELARLAQRSLDHELDRLSLPGDAIETLRALPADPRAGRRIQALAGLLEAHREIAQRVRAPERMRARLQVKPASGKAARRGDRRGRHG